MLIMKFLFIFSCSLLFLISINVSRAQKRKIKYCHVNQALNCFEFMRYFTGVENGTGIITSEKDMDLFCKFSTKHVPYCLKKWSERCGNKIHQDLIENLISKPFSDSFSDFCDPSKIYRKRYLKHSKCLHNIIKLTENYRVTCVQSLQAGLESLMNSTNLEQSFRTGCCVYNRWEKCITDHLNEYCGPDSRQIIIDFIHFGTMQTVSQLCPTNVFDPTSSQCVDLMPPLYTKAYGAKSKSYFSYLFSYWCPNVGYGIVDK